LLRNGVGSSIWSVSRGLAKTVDRYKSTLMLADEPRHGDLDGRGALSTLRLHEFCEYFLGTCIDQRMKALRAAAQKGAGRVSQDA
jgi:hypothetical protein